MFALEQNQTERVLTDRLRELGVAIDRGFEATSLTQDDHGVVVALRQPAGMTEQIHTHWVVGCDGAHSALRDLLASRRTGRHRWSSTRSRWPGCLAGYSPGHSARPSWFAYRT